MENLTQEMLEEAIIRLKELDDKTFTGYIGTPYGIVYIEDNKIKKASTAKAIEWLEDEISNAN